MRRVLVVVFFTASLAARAPYAEAAPVEPAADLSDTFRGLWDRFRGRVPAIQRPPNVGANVGLIVSWNVQTLGQHASRRKKDALRLGLGRALTGAGPMILAAQEIANDKGAETLARQLPESGRGWTMSFEDTPDAMNNALYFGPGVTVDCSGNLDIAGVRHPPIMAHVVAGQVDFTLLSVHLSYEKGDAAASASELKLIMAWARAQASRSGADPDFVIAGDFNLPTARGKERSARSGDRSWEPLEEVLGSGFTALVDEPTSRRGRQDAANNYDHFLVSDDFANEELVAAEAVGQAQIVLAEREAGARASDHFPIALTFLRSGAGHDGRPLVRDGASTCR